MKKISRKEAIRKVKSYKNPDKRCKYPWELSPLGYCWGYATEKDKRTKQENIIKRLCTKGCECWEVKG